MEILESTQDGLKHELKIRVPASEIETHINARLQEMAPRVKLPGFRPGKVPANILRQRYGRNVLGEVIDKAVNDSSKQAMADKGLRPATDPQIEVTSFEEGQDLEYKMDIEALPPIEIADLSQIKLEKDVFKPGEEEIQEALGKVAESYKHSHEVHEDRAVKKGDIAVIDFAGTCEGEAVPGMSANEFSLELGSGQFIPGFEDQVEGMKKGETRTVKVTFPDDYGNAELAGKEGVFEVTLKNIKEPHTPEINDAFAQKLGLENLDGLKDALRQQVEQEFDNIAKMKLKRKLLDKLDELHDIENPETLYNQELQGIRQQMEREGQSFEDLPAGEKKEYEDIARRRVKLGIILAEIGTRNNLDVTNQELQQAVIEQARQYPGQEQEVFEYYRSNQQALASLRGPVYEEKVINYILERAQIEEKEVSRQELLDEEETESKPAKKSASKSKSGAAKKSGGAKSAGSTAKKDTAKKDTDETGTAKSGSAKSGSAAKSGASKSGSGSKAKTAKKSS